MIGNSNALPMSYVYYGFAIFSLKETFPLLMNSSKEDSYIKIVM